MRPTLQTVANAVGVSRSTVSNAYSRPDQLSPALRERIHETARQLGYPGPNPTARSLRRGRVGAIGVLFTPVLSYAFTDPYAVQFLRGLAEAAERHDSGLLLVPLSGTDDETAARVVRDAAVDGFCVYCVPEWHQAMDVLRSRGLPVVGAERRTEDGPDVGYVGIDEQAATREVGAHLARLGHRRIAIVSEFLVAEQQRTGPVTLAAPAEIRYQITRERVTGFHEGLAEAGVAWADLLLIHVAANSRAEGARAAAYALDRADRPTAILAITDLLALGVVDALLARGLRPGEDVSVTGFDDIPDAVAIGLTTVRQPAVEKGRIAGRLLLDPPEDPAARHVLLPTELIIRSSTGPVERN